MAVMRSGGPSLCTSNHTPLLLVRPLVLAQFWTVSEVLRVDISGIVWGVGGDLEIRTRAVPPARALNEIRVRARVAPVRRVATYIEVLDPWQTNIRTVRNL